MSKWNGWRENDTSQKIKNIADKTWDEIITAKYDINCIWILTEVIAECGHNTTLSLYLTDLTKRLHRKYLNPT